MFVGDGVCGVFVGDGVCCVFVVGIVFLLCL